MVRDNIILDVQELSQNMNWLCIVLTNYVVVCSNLDLCEICYFHFFN